VTPFTRFGTQLPCHVTHKTTAFETASSQTSTLYGRDRGGDHWSSGRSCAGVGRGDSGDVVGHLPIIWDSKWGVDPALSISGLLYVRGETGRLPWWGEL
jgi:hypothetical protein